MNIWVRTKHVFSLTLFCLSAGVEYRALPSSKGVSPAYATVILLPLFCEIVVGVTVDPVTVLELQHKSLVLVTLVSGSVGGINDDV